jgi:branched-chain amino acid transport system substrate-binding protein
MKLKKLLALVMVLVIAMGSMIGCGKNEETTNTEDDTQETDVVETTEETAEETTGEGKIDSSLPKIKIGLVAPFSGGGAEWGHYYEDATKMAIDEINAAGGVLGGHELVYVVQDDQTTPEGTTSACNYLIDSEKVDMLTGFSQSALAMVAKEISRDKVFHIVASSQSVAITDEGHKWLFALTPTVADHATGLNNFILNGLKPKTMAIVVENSDYGKDNLALFQSMAEGLGTEIVDVEWITTTDTDFTMQLSKIKALKPELVYSMVTVPACYSQIFKQMKELGMDMLKVQCAGNLNPASIEATAGGMEGVYTADLWDIAVTKGESGTTHPESVEFAEKWEEKFGYPAHKASTQLYQAIKVYAAAVEQAGTYTDYDKLAEVMHEITYPSLWKSDIKFDETGRNHSDVYILQIVDGEAVLAE